MKNANAYNDVLLFENFFENIDIDENKNCSCGTNEISDITNFKDLVNSMGLPDAITILKILEAFEGVNEQSVSKLSYFDRYESVLSMIEENSIYRVNH